VVKINDRGPFHGNRLIDLSYSAAWKLGIVGKGTGLVEITTIDPSAPPAEPQIRLASNDPLPSSPLISPPADKATDEPAQSRLLEPSPPMEVIEAQNEASGLFLQVGAFGSADNAHRLKNRLETELKTGVLVEQHKLADAPIYRVQVGPIASVELCDDLTTRLNGMGLPGARLVVR
jgi:rare lipoprotein A